LIRFEDELERFPAAPCLYEGVAQRLQDGIECYQVKGLVVHQKKAGGPVGRDLRRNVCQASGLPGTVATTLATTVTTTVTTTVIEFAHDASAWVP
jgi:hypothetical protein